MEYIIIDTLKIGLPYALLALGIFLSYRILDIADLSAEGTFTLGGVVTAVLLVLGLNAWIATLCGILAGFLAGLFTGFLHTKLKISGLLSGIITMTALFSINMVIMGFAPSSIIIENGIVNIKENTSGFSSAVYLNGLNIRGESIKTIYNSFSSVLDSIVSFNYQVIIIAFIVVLVINLVLYWFFGTEFGMALRSTGINQKMSRAQGINTSLMIIIGLGIGNALIAASGALFMQTQGSCSSTMGVGTLVIGLASIIIGEAIFGKKSFKNWLISVSLGAIIYYFIIVLVVKFGLPSQYRKSLYALLILIVLIIPLFKKYFRKNVKKGGITDASITNK